MHYLFVALLAVLTTFIAVDLVGLVGVLVHDSPGALVFKVKGIAAHLNADVAHLTPVLTPGVADNPVFKARVRVCVITDN